MNRVTRSAGAAASLVPVIVDFTTHVLEEAHRSEIYLTGQNRLLGQPEYQDLTKAQEVLGALDEDTLSNLPRPARSGQPRSDPRRSGKRCAGAEGYLRRRDAL